MSPLIHQCSSTHICREDQFDCAFKINDSYSPYVKFQSHPIYKFTTSVTELGSVTEGQPGPARHSRTPGFSPTGPAVGVPGPVRHRRPAGSLVPCTGGTGTVVLWFPARVDHGLEEERYTAAGERRGGGGQRREEKKRREEKSVAWRRSVALLQVREEEEEDRGEKRREILIGADQDQDLFFSIATLSCFQTRSSVSGFLSLALLRKPNREAKA